MFRRTPAAAVFLDALRVRGEQVSGVRTAHSPAEPTPCCPAAAGIRAPAARAEPIALPLGWTVHGAGDRQQYLHFLRKASFPACT